MIFLVFLKGRTWNFFLVYILKATFPCLFLTASTAAITGPVRKKKKKANNQKLLRLFFAAVSWEQQKPVCCDQTAETVQKRTCIVALGGTMGSSTQVEHKWILLATS